VIDFTHEVERLSARLAGSDAVGVLEQAASAYPGRIAFATSLGLEDQVLTHLIAENDIAIPLFTLDTGRLFEETYELIERTQDRYGQSIAVYSPHTAELERMVSTHGVNLFRQGVTERKLCCAVRKLGPLRRAMIDLDAWVCGLRSEQSVTRDGVSPVEWDAGNGLVKFNPLHDWTEQQVRDFIAENDIPYNPLHDAGMPSIGCAPCTRAIGPGEDPRAGRWWWESPEQKECGLHARKAATTADELTET
jgi:phosphoadenosine phosphosulfate reductase